jgi:hypothetical protein
MPLDTAALWELASLRDQGILTQEEFLEEKAKVLKQQWIRADEFATVMALANEDRGVNSTSSPPKIHGHGFSPTVQYMPLPSSGHAESDRSSAWQTYEHHAPEQNAAHEQWRHNQHEEEQRRIEYARVVKQREQEVLEAETQQQAREAQIEVQRREELEIKKRRQEFEQRRELDIAEEERRHHMEMQEQEKQPHPKVARPQDRSRRQPEVRSDVHLDSCVQHDGAHADQTKLSPQEGKRSVDRRPVLAKSPKPFHPRGSSSGPESSSSQPVRRSATPPPVTVPMTPSNDPGSPAYSMPSARSRMNSVATPRSRSAERPGRGSPSVRPSSPTPSCSPSTLHGTLTSPNDDGSKANPARLRYVMYTFVLVALLTKAWPCLLHLCASIAMVAILIAWPSFAPRKVEGQLRLDVHSSAQAIRKQLLRIEHLLPVAQHAEAQAFDAIYISATALRKNRESLDPKCKTTRLSWGNDSEGGEQRKLQECRCSSLVTCKLRTFSFRAKRSAALTTPGSCCPQPCNACRSIVRFKGLRAPGKSHCAPFSNIWRK